MNLTGQQQQALEHARHILAEMPPADSTTFLAEWYRAIGRALAELVAAFDDDGGAA